MLLSKMWTENKILTRSYIDNCRSTNSLIKIVWSYDPESSEHSNWITQGWIVNPQITPSSPGRVNVLQKVSQPHITFTATQAVLHLHQHTPHESLTYELIKA